MKEFVLNKCGVCVNPNKVEYRNKGYFYCLETAYINGHWVMGFMLCASGNGKGMPCIDKWGIHFFTEEEALKYAAQKAIDFFSQKFYTTDNSTRLAKVPADILDSLQQYIKPLPIQLSLFDWVMEQQKKPYIPPTTEVTETKPEEPIACSYYEDHHSGKPGHGWGDRNHDHYGPPGQNKKNGITDIWEDL